MPIVVDPSIGNPTPPTSATSSDGKLTAYLDSAHAGVLLKGDFSTLSTKPVKIRFYRGTTLVRSGDAAWSPGGIGVAYDHEAPLGTSCAWTAVPIFADGTTGTSSTAATLTTSAMADDVDCWVKPIADPGKAVAFSVHTDQIEISWSARTQSYAVPGRRLPIGTYDKRTPNAPSITLRTKTKADKDNLNKALDLGPVLVQLRNTASSEVAAYGIDDFYAIPGDSTERYFLGMFSQLRDIPSTFLPCDRPPTLDAPLIIPGTSWDEQFALAPTWNARLSTWATWNAAIGLP